MNIRLFAVMTCLVVTIGAVSLADWSDTLQHYSCIEVETFTVERDAKAGRKEARASVISGDLLDRLQKRIVVELKKPEMAKHVNPAEHSDCADTTLVFGGKVTDFKSYEATRGGSGGTTFVGAGGGVFTIPSGGSPARQVIEVDCYVKNKGLVLAEKKITCRIPSGFFSFFGSAERGERKFAKKVASFISSTWPAK